MPPRFEVWYPSQLPPNPHFTRSTSRAPPRMQQPRAGQGMIMAAIGNVMHNDSIRRYVVRGEVK